jgi:hypothetical protein
VRVAAALLVAATGAIHLYLWFDYFHRVHVVGDLFLANAAAGALLTVALLASGSVLLLVGGAAFALSTFVAFAVSTRYGLFGYRESFWGTWQESAGGVELAATIVLVYGALARRNVT